MFGNSLQPKPCPHGVWWDSLRKGTIKVYFSLFDKVNHSFLFGNGEWCFYHVQETFFINLYVTATYSMNFWHLCFWKTVRSNLFLTLSQQYGGINSRKLKVRLTQSLLLSEIFKGVGRSPLSFLSLFTRREVKRERDLGFCRRSPASGLLGWNAYAAVTSRSLWQTSQMLNHFFPRCFWAQC